MRWWTTWGENASDRCNQERGLLTEEAQRRGAHRVLHISDWGFAENPWSTMAFVHTVGFVMRWAKQYKLVDDQGRVRKACKSPLAYALGIIACVSSSATFGFLIHSPS